MGAQQAVRSGDDPLRPPVDPAAGVYQRLSGWVAVGGTLLIVGHLQSRGHGHGHDPGYEPPADASITRADITAVLDASRWQMVTAEEHVRTLTSPDGRAVPLHDVVVRATRRT